MINIIDNLQVYYDKEKSFYAVLQVNTMQTCSINNITRADCFSLGGVLCGRI